MGMRRIGFRVWVSDSGHNPVSQDMISLHNVSSITTAKQSFSRMLESTPVSHIKINVNRPTKQRTQKRKRPMTKLPFSKQTKKYDFPARTNSINLSRTKKFKKEKRKQIQELEVLADHWVKSSMETFQLNRQYSQVQQQGSQKNRISAPLASRTRRPRVYISTSQESVRQTSRNAAQARLMLLQRLNTKPLQNAESKKEIIQDLSQEARKIDRQGWKMEQSQPARTKRRPMSAHTSQHRSLVQDSYPLKRRPKSAIYSRKKPIITSHSIFPHETPIEKIELQSEKEILRSLLRTYAKPIRFDYGKKETMSDLIRQKKFEQHQALTKHRMRNQLMS